MFEELNPRLLFVALTVFAFGISISFGSENGPEFISNNTENITAVVGSSVTLSCSVENLGIYKVAWINTGTSSILSVQNSVITRNTRISVTVDKNDELTTIYLHFVNILEKDEGNYRCQINTNDAKASAIKNLLVVAEQTTLENVDHSDEELLSSTSTLRPEDQGPDDYESYPMTDEIQDEDSYPMSDEYEETETILENIDPVTDDPKNSANNKIKNWLAFLGMIALVVM